MRYLLVLFFLTLCILPLGAEQKIIPLSSPIYDHIDDLYTQAWLAPPFNSRPWTEDEALYYYQGIDATPHPLLESRHIYSDEDLRINLSPSLSLEGYAKVDQGGTENHNIPWLYGYSDRLSLADLELGFHFGRNLYMGGTIPFMQEYLAVNRTGNFSNLILDFNYFESQFPASAYLGLGGEHWSLFLGRDELSMGPGYSGKLIVSNNPHWLDQLRFSTWWKDFKYTAAIIYNQPYLRDSERPDVEAMAGANFADSRYFIFHRFDLRFFNIWNVAITEGLSWGGRELDLRFFNPLIILHNFYEWSFASSLFSVDSQITVLPGLTAYGQFMFNAIQSEYEQTRYNDASIPSASGWMAGISYALPLGLPPLRITLGAEFVHTDPWLYIREHALISYYWRRRAISNITGSDELIDLPLGYSWGPDTNLFIFWTETHWEISSMLLFDLNLSLSIVHDGEQEVTDPFSNSREAIALRTPSGIAEFYTIIHLEPQFSWTLDKHHRLIFRFNSDIFWIANAGHQQDVNAFDAQFALGITWNIQP